MEQVQNCLFEKYFIVAEPSCLPSILEFVLAKLDDLVNWARRVGK